MMKLMNVYDNMNHISRTKIDIKLIRINKNSLPNAVDLDDLFSSVCKFSDTYSLIEVVEGISLASTNGLKLDSSTGFII